jgi:hypothetical protein
MGNEYIAICQIQQKRDRHKVGLNGVSAMTKLVPKHLTKLPHRKHHNANQLVIFHNW